MRIRHLVVPVLTAILLLSLALPPAPAAAAVISDALPSRWAGFYLPGCPLDVTSLSTLEGKVGASAAVVNYFQNISGGFTAVQAGRAADHGAIPPRHPRVLERRQPTSLFAEEDLGRLSGHLPAHLRAECEGLRPHDLAASVPRDERHLVPVVRHSQRQHAGGLRPGVAAYEGHLRRRGSHQRE